MADVRVRDLTFHYTPGVPVLKGLNISFSPGTTAIVGQNGAGKSTLVRLLNGLLKPVSGSVTVDGIDTRETTTAQLAATVGLVFQNPADQLFKSTVMGEVMFGPRNLGCAPEEARRRSEAALAEFDLLPFSSANPYDLGLAERKLVTVAGVVAMETDVVILDEPTIAQDAAGVRQLSRLVRRLTDVGRTVITITHDMDFVATCFDRVIVMRDGEVLQDGTAHDVFSHDEVMKQAGLEPPAVTELSHRVGLKPPAITVEEFLRRLPG